jgi:ureidoacrylate peracid hydrolase
MQGTAMTIDGFSKVKKETTWTIDPQATAVLLIDMLNDFLVEGGRMVLPRGDHIVPNQKAVIHAARKINIPIIYVNDAHRPGLREDREFLKRGQH